MRSIPRDATTRVRNNEKNNDAQVVRALLEQQWARRVNEITELMVRWHDARAAVARAETGEVTGFDIEVISEQLARSRQGLLETEEALARLADGSYGWCERCVQPIAPERLEVLPDARLCTPCQGLSRPRR